MRGPLPPSADPAMQAALAAVYEAFAAPTPAVIEGCPCCIGTRNTDVLLTKPLRALTGSDLYRYISGAFLTVGGERDFRYLMPRILELALVDPGSVPDIQIVLGKLRLAGWVGWPARERAPIEALISLWFEHALARDLLIAEEWAPPGDSAAVLCGAARADLNITTMAAALATDEAWPVRAALSERYAKPLARGDIPRDFWEDAPEGWRQLASVLI